ncbi:MAG: LamG domain-containing protein [Candidatus Poseidoniia archaeon]
MMQIIHNQLVALFLLSVAVIDAQFALPTFQAAHKPHDSNIGAITNYVLVLNGTNEHAYYADNSNFEPANWSIQAWIDPSEVPTNSNKDWIINKLKVYRIGLELISGEVQVTGQLRTDGSYRKVNSGNDNFYVTTGGGWYHVVLTFDGNNLVLYVNGDEKDAISNSSYTTNNYNSKFSIGRRYDTENYYYNGRIDDVSFWNTGLSADEVAALYNSGAGISASSNSGNYTSSDRLVFYLQMQQNLNDSENSYNFTPGNIGSDDYEVTSFE